MSTLVDGCLELEYRDGSWHHIHVFGLRFWSISCNLRFCFFFFRKKNYTFNDHNHETRAFYLTKQCYTYNWESFMTCFTAALAKPCAAEFASLLALQIYLHANFTSYVFNTPCLSSTNCPYGPYQLKFCSVTFTTFTTWTTSPFIMILCSPKSRLNSTAYNAANANLVMLLAASIHPLRSHTMIPTSLYLKTWTKYDSYLLKTILSQNLYILHISI